MKHSMVMDGVDIMLDDRLVLSSGMVFLHSGGNLRHTGYNMLWFWQDQVPIPNFKELAPKWVSLLYECVV